MFRTELPLTPHPQQLPLSAHVLTVGSCFSDTIGSRLAAAKVNTLINPFGTVFNPLSACQLLRAAAGEDMDWQQHLVEARGRWQSYDLHATIGADSPVTLLQRIQGLVQEVGSFLEQTDVVVLTLGTAFAYRLLETDAFVSNCHKAPAERFEKVLLTPDEIINAVAETHAYLRRRNPKLRFILTVSPVRHLKDTLPLNSVSKSVLRVACHYLSELLPDVSYFPAYELLVDDLRDYRFYAADMLHPSEVAENYIWERFTRTYFDPAFGRFRKEWESVRQALQHRPLYAEAPEHREFLEATLARLHKLAQQVDVQSEIREVERQLEALPLPVQAPEPEPEEDEDDEERIDIGEPALSAAAESVASPVTAVTAAVVVEPAPEPNEEDELEEEAPVEGEASELPTQPKKKRRNRGGAKRTARKRAAQLQAQLAAEAALQGQPDAVPTEAEAQPEPSPIEIVEPSAATDAPAAGAAEETVESAAPETVVSVPEPEVAQPESAPAAPASQPAAEQPAPTTPAASDDWLQLMDEPETQPEEAPARRTGRTGRGKAARPAAEKKPRQAKDRVITTPPRSSRRKLPTLYADPAATPEEVPTEAVPVEAVVPTPAEPAVAAPAPTLPAAKAPAPVVETPEPVEAVVPAPVETAGMPKKPRKPRAKPAPKSVPEVIAEPAAPEPAPVAEAPKRRRPPRKKAAPTDETPSAS